MVKPGGLNSLKLSKRIPTNKTRLKGLLTYRTIQFSMSSGCCHPKISLLSRRASELSLYPLPNWGTKILSADLITFNSAAQSSVNFAAILRRLRRLSKTFFSFFPGLRTRNWTQFTRTRAVVKIFLQLFFAARTSNSQRTKGGNPTTTQNLRKCFLDYS